MDFWNRKAIRTAPLPVKETEESTPYATRTVTIEREIDVFTGTIKAVKTTYGDWQLKPGVAA